MLTSIYKITHKESGKSYIGKTIQHPQIRWKQHLVGMGFGKKMPIHLALNKHGVDSFTFEVIYSCFEEKDSGFAELYFINQFNTLSPNGYNITLSVVNIKDNPYLSTETKEPVPVQSIESETLREYNLSKRTRYPVVLWQDIKSLYDDGKSPKQINQLLNTKIPHRTLIGKLKALGCDTSNRTRNILRANGRYNISKTIKLSIVNDYLNGLNTTQLEIKHNYRNQFIRKTLVEAGVYKSRDKKICRTA